jgi:hypothetical protein
MLESLPLPLNIHSIRNAYGKQTNKNGKAIRLTGRGCPYAEAVILYRTSAHRWRWDCPSYAPADRPLPPGRFLVLTSVRSPVYPGKEGFYFILFGYYVTRLREKRETTMECNSSKVTICWHSVIREAGVFVCVDYVNSNNPMGSSGMEPATFQLVA